MAISEMARYLVCVNILQPLDHHYSSEQRHHRSGRFFDSYFSCSTLDHDLSRVTRPRAARDHRRTRQSFTSFTRYRHQYTLLVGHECRHVDY